MDYDAGVGEFFRKVFFELPNEPRLSAARAARDQNILRITFIEEIEESLAKGRNLMLPADKGEDILIEVPMTKRIHRGRSGTILGRRTRNRMLRNRQGRLKNRTPVGSEPNR
jgi:hypothetical protein